MLSMRKVTPAEIPPVCSICRGSAWDTLNELFLEQGSKDSEHMRVSLNAPKDSRAKVE